MSKIVKYLLWVNMLRAYCFASCLTLHFMHCIMLTLAHIQPFMH
jgi:hypothetical protein